MPSIGLGIRRFTARVVIQGQNDCAGSDLSSVLQGHFWAPEVYFYVKKY